MAPCLSSVYSGKSVIGIWCWPVWKRFNKKTSKKRLLLYSKTNNDLQPAERSPPKAPCLWLRSRSQVRTRSTQSIQHWPSLHVQFSLTRLISGQLNWGTDIQEAALLFTGNVNNFNQWKDMIQFFTLNVYYIYHVFMQLLLVICTPESCLTVPKTLRPSSTCFPGYRSATKPHGSCFHISAAPEKLVKETNRSSFSEYPHTDRVVQCKCNRTCSVPTVKPFM